MAKPLRSDNPAPVNLQFQHFGVLNDGSQSRFSLFTSIVINVVIAVIIIIIGAVVKTTVLPPEKLATVIELPVKPPPPEPKIVPKLPPPPRVQKAEAPKIKLSEPKLTEPKLPEVKMPHPAPVALPAPPKRIQPPPAPRVVNLAQARPAAVINNSPRPSPVALGRADNPIAPSNRPAVADVNLGNRGLAGMPASNTGSGPAAKAVTLGSGSAGSQNMNGRDNAANAVRGVKLGVAGATGPMNSHGRAVAPVSIGQLAPPPTPRAEAPTATHSGSAPKVLFKPRPQYTADALKMHIEGTVSVRLRVSSSGTVHVLGVTRDLGHGLGESAVRAVEGTRFAPATDASGRPIDWEGIVNVAFQLAG